MNMFKKILVISLASILALFVLVSLGVSRSDSAVTAKKKAAVKKKVAGKKKVASKKQLKAPAKKLKKAKKVAPKKTIGAKEKAATKPKTKKSSTQNSSLPPQYTLPVGQRTISQKYSLEEVIDETAAENITAGLRELGVENASVDLATNTLSVKFNTQRITAIGIISKLKSLGYSIKRID